VQRFGKKGEASLQRECDLMSEVYENQIIALKSEIARLCAKNQEWITQAAEMEAQRDKLRAALEAILEAHDYAEVLEIARKALAEFRK
jgi:hypothetical protein